MTVGVRIHRDLPERELELLGGALAVHTEHLVVVALYRHAPLFVFGRKLRTPSDLDQRRPNHAVAYAIPASQLRDDGVLGVVGRLLVADRLVHLRVESGTD